MNSVFCVGTQAEGLPAVAQTAPESDSDSGMGSPAEEMVTETVNNREELQGDETTTNNRQQLYLRNASQDSLCFFCIEQLMVCTS